MISHTKLNNYIFSEVFHHLFLWFSCQLLGLYFQSNTCSQEKRYCQCDFRPKLAWWARLKLDSTEWEYSQRVFQQMSSIITLTINFSVPVCVCMRVGACVLLDKYFPKVSAMSKQITQFTLSSGSLWAKTAY